MKRHSENFEVDEFQQFDEFQNFKAESFIVNEIKVNQVESYKVSEDSTDSKLDLESEPEAKKDEAFGEEDIRKAAKNSQAQAQAQPSSASSVASTTSSIASTATGVAAGVAGAAVLVGTMAAVLLGNPSVDLISFEVGATDVSFVLEIDGLNEGMDYLIQIINENIEFTYPAENGTNTIYNDELYPNQTYDLHVIGIDEMGSYTYYFTHNFYTAVSSSKMMNYEVYYEPDYVISFDLSLTNTAARSMYFIQILDQNDEVVESTEFSMEEDIMHSEIYFDLFTGDYTAVLIEYREPADNEEFNEKDAYVELERQTIKIDPAYVNVQKQTVFTPNYYFYYDSNYYSLTISTRYSYGKSYMVYVYDAEGENIFEGEIVYDIMSESISYDILSEYYDVKVIDPETEEIVYTTRIEPDPNQIVPLEESYYVNGSYNFADQKPQILVDIEITNYDENKHHSAELIDNLGNVIEIELADSIYEDTIDLDEFTNTIYTINLYVDSELVATYDIEIPEEYIVKPAEAYSIDASYDVTGSKPQILVTIEITNFDEDKTHYAVVSDNLDVHNQIDVPSSTLETAVEFDVFTNTIYTIYLYVDNELAVSADVQIPEEYINNGEESVAVTNSYVVVEGHRTLIIDYEIFNFIEGKEHKITVTSVDNADMTTSELINGITGSVTLTDAEPGDYTVLVTSGDDNLYDNTISIEDVTRNATFEPTFTVVNNGDEWDKVYQMDFVIVGENLLDGRVYNVAITIGADSLYSNDFSYSDFPLSDVVDSVPEGTLYITITEQYDNDQITIATYEQVIEYPDDMYPDYEISYNDVTTNDGATLDFEFTFNPDTGFEVGTAKLVITETSNDGDTENEVEYSVDGDTIYVEYQIASTTTSINLTFTEQLTNRERELYSYDITISEIEVPNPIGVDLASSQYRMVLTNEGYMFGYNPGVVNEKQIEFVLAIYDPSTDSNIAEESIGHESEIMISSETLEFGVSYELKYSILVTYSDTEVTNDTTLLVFSKDKPEITYVSVGFGSSNSLNIDYQIDLSDEMFAGSSLEFRAILDGNESEYNAYTREREYLAGETYSVTISELPTTFTTLAIRLVLTKDNSVVTYEDYDVDVTPFFTVNAAYVNTTENEFFVDYSGIGQLTVSITTTSMTSGNPETTEEEVTTSPYITEFSAGATYTFTMKSGGNVIDTVTYTTQAAPQVSYTYDAVNPFDALVTYNDDDTINLYIDTNLNTESNDIFVRFKYYSSSETTYRMVDTKGLVSLEDLPMDSYYYTYQVIYQESSSDLYYILEETSPSGGIEVLSNEPYFYIMNQDDDYYLHASIGVTFENPIIVTYDDETTEQFEFDDSSTSELEHLLVGSPTHVVVTFTYNSYGRYYETYTTKYTIKGNRYRTIDIEATI